MHGEGPIGKEGARDSSTETLRKRRRRNASAGPEYSRLDEEGLDNAAESPEEEELEREAEETRDHPSRGWVLLGLSFVASGALTVSSIHSLVIPPLRSNDGGTSLQHISSPSCSRSPSSAGTSPENGSGVSLLAYHTSDKVGRTISYFQSVRPLESDHLVCPVSRYHHGLPYHAKHEPRTSTMTARLMKC